VVNELTAVVLTLNEENYISECLESLKWCQQVVVLDSLSTDRTVEIAHQMGARVVQRPFINFADQRNAGIELVDSEWIFFVDADERVTAEMAEEVSRVIKDAAYDGWWVPTKSNYFGKWMKYGGFYPDYHLRLARKGKYRFDPRQKVHEKPIVEGKVGYLKNPLIHICYQNFHELKQAAILHSKLMSEIKFEQRIRPKYHIIIAPLLVFYDQYLRKQSYKDGIVGLVLSISMAYYNFNIYRRLWLLWIKN
jgi:glycosyltransferase involved in cell wall biosynthesis